MNEPNPKPPESSSPTSEERLPVVSGPVVEVVPEKSRPPHQQLGDLPDEELEAFAEEFGLNPRKYRDKADLIQAIHERRQVIASLDRSAMMEVIHWAGRQVHPDITHEQLAIEIAQIRSMRFSGLSEKGLVVLCLLRGCRITGRESREELINHLKRQEGFFAKIRRKTRRWLGKRVEKMIGDPTQATPPPSQEPVNQPTGPVSGPRPQALREEVEDSGFFGGIANRVKRQADSYVNQKLDEIEARIDRKLDEIDRRLAEWRDKEIANRIRILKITLWASVFVAGVSLIYSYIQVEMKRWNQPAPLRPSTTPTSLMVPDSTIRSTVFRIETPMNRSSEN
jgi:siroheme synthase (precorrin-2 oxidase/ferrochelatase)